MSIVEADMAGVKSQVGMLLLRIGSCVVHLETMTYGNVQEVYPDGCWHDGRAKYLPPSTPTDDLKNAEGVTDDYKFMSSPIALLSCGNAFIIRPNAFAAVGREAAALHDNLRSTLKIVMIGFASASHSTKLTAHEAIAVARGVLLQQLRALDAQSAGSSDRPPA